MTAPAYTDPILDIVAGKGNRLPVVGRGIAVTDTDEFGVALAGSLRKQAMEKAEGHAIPLVPEATIVPSGVVHLMELQEQGWSYVRP